MARNLSSSKMHLQLSLYLIILQWTDGQQIRFLQMLQTSFLSIETPAISINSQSYMNEFWILSFRWIFYFSFLLSMESSLRPFQWMLSALHYSSICKLLHLITPLASRAIDISDASIYWRFKNFFYTLPDLLLWHASLNYNALFSLLISILCSFC